MTTHKEALKLARQLLWRYRHETPIGRQPHMICQEVDEAFERIDEALAQPEQEPVAQCTNSDTWNCKYCHKTEVCEALKNFRNFGQPKQEPSLVKVLPMGEGNQPFHYVECQHLPEGTLLSTHPAPQRKPLTDASAQFNAAIDFAIQQGSEAGAFLRSWREGDTSEWPEFEAAHGIKGDA